MKPLQVDLDSGMKCYAAELDSYLVFVRAAVVLKMSLAVKIQ